MPNRVTKTTGAGVYGDPFVGPAEHPVQLPVDVSALLIDGTHGAQVDADGRLKPGVPFKVTGGKLVPLDATSGEFVYGVVKAPIDLGLATVPPTNTSLGAVTADPIIAVECIGVVQRDIVEDNLGRVLHADEVAAFKAAGSLLRLTET